MLKKIGDVIEIDGNGHLGKVIGYKVAFNRPGLPHAIHRADLDANTYYHNGLDKTLPIPEGTEIWEEVEPLTISEAKEYRSKQKSQ